MSALLLLALLAAPSAPLTPVSARSCAFRIVSSCSCAECGFDAQRELKRFPGVKKVSISTAAKELDVQFDEGQKPISSLASAISKLDLGKGSLLLWTVPDGVAMDRAAAAVSKIPGIGQARPGKKRQLEITFSGKANVGASAIDEAVKSAT